jgi:hypothetical protein
MLPLPQLVLGRAYGRLVLLAPFAWRSLLHRQSEVLSVLVDNLFVADSRPVGIKSAIGLEQGRFGDSKQSQQLARQMVAGRQPRPRVSDVGKRNAGGHELFGHVGKRLDRTRAGCVPPSRLPAVIYGFIEQGDALLRDWLRRHQFRRDHGPAARPGFERVGSQDIDQCFELVLKLVAADGDGQAVPDVCRQPALAPVLGNRARCHLVSEASGADRHPSVFKGEVPKGLGRDDDPARLTVGRSAAAKVINGSAGQRPLGEERLGRVRADPARLDGRVLR